MDDPLSPAPPTPEPDAPLLPQTQTRPRHTHSASSKSSLTFPRSSPLNPNAQPQSRQPSDASTSTANRNSGSMILWKLAGPQDIDYSLSQPSLLPPDTRRFSRFSVHSSSGDSLISYTDDSKYPASPSLIVGNPKGRPASGFIPYSYDPLLDPDPDLDEKERMRDERRVGRSYGMNWRGLINVGTIVVLLTGLVLLFTLLPIVTFLRRNKVLTLITGNAQINQTGQAPDLPNLPSLIDKHTPSEALTRTGFDGNTYNLVFSDEFEIPNRTFWPGDDPYWEAVDLWYWATTDLEWYDPGQITTRDGKLVIKLENTPSHGLQYKSGMLQSWNKFCFTSGYIEVSLSLPGRNSDAQGYWPGAWIMGNLGRPGFGASTDGMWPYSYDTCDLGTFPNQTIRDPVTGAPQGPPAALHTDAGRDKYNFELSWLSGQRLSACGCQKDFEAGQHPGPRGDLGRGAPEIDILEAQKNKLGEGGKVSQSAQFAPFNADYQANYLGLEIYDETLTARNSYNGSAVQQAITCLTTLPDRIYAGTGAEFATFGFEYFANPDKRSDGYIEWMSDGVRTFRMDASTVQADVPGGSGISDRLVPEEPMSIVLNLAISTSFQTVDVTTLDFPAEFLIDYVRVYQRDGATNIGCDPPERPTRKYIEDHLLAYSNPNVTMWRDTEWPKPTNRLLDGEC